MTANRSKSFLNEKFVTMNDRVPRRNYCPSICLKIQWNRIGSVGWDQIDLNCLKNILNGLKMSREILFEIVRKAGYDMSRQMRRQYVKYGYFSHPAANKSP